MQKWQKDTLRSKSDPLEKSVQCLDYADAKTIVWHCLNSYNGNVSYGCDNKYARKLFKSIVDVNLDDLRLVKLDL